MKKWLRRQPVQPLTIEQLQALLDRFAIEYNHPAAPVLPRSATPATIYAGRPKATPSADRSGETHDRVRTDKVGYNGTVTLRVAGRLRHIGIGRTHAGTDIFLLNQDLHVRIVDAATGEILRDLVIDPARDYQGTGRPPGPAPKKK